MHDSIEIRDVEALRKYLPARMICHMLRLPVFPRYIRSATTLWHPEQRLVAIHLFVLWYNQFWLIRSAAFGLLHFLPSASANAEHLSLESLPRWCLLARELQLELGPVA